MDDAGTILGSTVSFLAILNPFALCLYLAGTMDDLDDASFRRVLFWASLVSLLVFLVFAYTGEPFLKNILGIRPEALRIFGGVIFFNVGYIYVTKGYRGMVMLRGDVDELPSEIALPFMIGAGTITQAIITGREHPALDTAAVMLLGMAITFLIVIAFKRIRDRMRNTHERVFLRYVNILSRANGLLIGALSTEMVVRGIHDLWTAKGI